MQSELLECLEHALMAADSAGLPIDHKIVQQIVRAQEDERRRLWDKQRCEGCGFHPLHCECDKLAELQAIEDRTKREIEMGGVE